MNTTTKVAICSTLVSVFAWIGANATGLCSAAPAPYNALCWASGKAVGAAGEAIKSTMPDGGAHGSTSTSTTK